MRELNFLTGRIVDAAFRSHSKLAPGLLESVHEAVLERDLIRQGVHVGSQKPISFEFEGMVFENAFRADLVVENGGSSG